MKIRNLPFLVTTARAEWILATTWMGFTPGADNLTSRNKCEQTILRQLNGGYILEYATKTFSKPNPGFDSDPAYLALKRAHEDYKGHLTAVHKLGSSARQLAEFFDKTDYRNFQAMWGQPSKKHRWSVAFPVVESYDIIGHPDAKRVLGETEYKSLFQCTRAGLREVTDRQRELIADLEIERRK